MKGRVQISTRCYVSYLQSLLADYVREDLACEGILAPHPDGHVGVFASPTEKASFCLLSLRLLTRLLAILSLILVFPTRFSSSFSRFLRIVSLSLAIVSLCLARTIMIHS